jgi:nickel transport system substrate-binding protein
MAQWTTARLKGAAAGAVLSALVGWSGAEARDFQFSWPIGIGPVNPHQYEPNAFFAQDMISEPLVAYGAGGVLEPALAERWSTSQDGRVLTFHLRRGVVFSDGTPFDAKAVQRNFDEILAQRGEHDWLALVGMIEKTEAAKPHLFRIVLKAAYYPALQELP